MKEIPGTDKDYPRGQPELPEGIAEATRGDSRSYPRGQSELPEGISGTTPGDDSYRRILKQYWGYDSFRGIQEDIIHSIGRGEDTLGLMPTGGGKSITFQVPALAREGLCLVVTPLIALMKDQVDRLRARGIPAVSIHSGLSPRQIDIALDNCVYGDVKFLYVAPERLATEAFRLRVVRMNVSLLAVDEAH